LLRQRACPRFPAKGWASLGAVLCLLSWGSGVANANILVNPYLDQTSVFSQNNPTPTGWTIEAFKTISGDFLDGASSEPWCNVAEDGGSGLFFKPFQGDQGSGNYLTVHFYQDNPATPGTKFTFSGYASAEANYCGFVAEGPTKTLFVLQFLDAAGGVLSSNVLDLVAAGLPSGGPGPNNMIQFTMPELTAPANTATVRAGVSMIEAYSTTGSQSFFVDAFVLESVAGPGAPVISTPPAHTTVAPGATATFTVGVANPTGVSYQWQLNSVNLVNGGNLSGATGPTLTITSASGNDVGHYRVLVSNTAGSVYSPEATLTLVGINFYPTIMLTGKIGDTYRVDYATSLEPTTWIPLSTNVLASSPQLVVDSSSPGSNTRFYRAVFLP
jgi:hypothetical protein